MRPQTGKELMRYCKRKGHLFDAQAKVATDKKLNQLTSQLNDTLQGRHARNLFFFNDVGQTLDTLDHLLITPKGLILIEKIPVQKQLIKLDAQWWQNQRSGALVPNENYLLSQVAQHLTEVLKGVVTDDIPMFFYPVSDKPFMPEVLTLETLGEQVLTDVKNSTVVLSSLDMQKIEQALTQAHETAVQTKTTLYCPSFIQTYYNPLKPIQVSKNKFKEHPLVTVYQVLNDWMYEELPEARLYHQVKLPNLPPHQNTIQTLILSSKGILLLSYLEPESKIQVDPDLPKWSISKIEAGEWKVLSMDNPILLLETQANHLLQQLKAPVPITYRIIGMDPIDLDLKHPSLVLQLHLNHALNKYRQEGTQTLNEAQIMWLRQRLKK